MKELLNMLDASPVNFLAVKYAEDFLSSAGFEKVEMGAMPKLQPGKGYYITKNGSALFAFRVGSGAPTDGFKLICAHTDSPCFRVKPAPEMWSEGGMVRLNTEVYGGPIPVYPDESQAGGFISVNALYRVDIDFDDPAVRQLQGRTVMAKIHHRERLIGKIFDFTVAVLRREF